MFLLRVLYVRLFLCTRFCQDALVSSKPTVTGDSNILYCPFNISNSSAKKLWVENKEGARIRRPRYIFLFLDIFS